MVARSYGQYCGVVSALELVGEKWALLIIRDLLVGPRRFTDLHSGLPKIPTNVLTARLKTLQEGGVVRRVPLANCGLVYELTDYGQALEPVVLELGRWGFHAMGDPEPDDIITVDSMTMAFRTAFQAEVARQEADTVYDVHLGPVVLRLTVAGGSLTVGTVTTAPADIALAAGPPIRELIADSMTAEAAIATGIVQIQHGDPALLNRFARTFTISPITAKVS